MGKKYGVYYRLLSINLLYNWIPLFLFSLKGNCIMHPQEQEVVDAQSFTQNIIG